MAAAKALQDFRAAHPDDYRHHPESIALFDEFLEHAPPEVFKAFHDKAVECNLVPETKFVNDAGEPVYTCQQVADQLGIPVEQVDKQMRENFGDELQFGTIHRVQ